MESVVCVVTVRDMNGARFAFVFVAILKIKYYSKCHRHLASFEYARSHPQSTHTQTHAPIQRRAILSTTTANKIETAFGEKIDELILFVLDRAFEFTSNRILFQYYRIARIAV